jgi:phage repressor protein C with HTH and peptisase S24 domain
MMNTAGERIKSARSNAQLSQGELASRCGWSNGQKRISNYESGYREPGYADLAAIGRVLNVSAAWLAFGGSPKLEAASGEAPIVNVSDDIHLPLVTESDITSADFQQSNKATSHIRLTQSQLKEANVSAAHGFCMTVEGNSMEPVLPDGALIGFDTSATAVKDGELYVVQYGPLVQVRVLERLPDGYRLKVYNDRNYSATEVKGDETGKLSVLGRVFWYSVLR